MSSATEGMGTGWIRLTTGGKRNGAQWREETPPFGLFYVGVREKGGQRQAPG